VGDRVVCADVPLGAYATARIYPADRLVRIPDGVSDAQAAASFFGGVTAHMLPKEEAPLQRDDTVLFSCRDGRASSVNERRMRWRATPLVSPCMFSAELP
jgi:NADPH2:quinone reductase